MSLTCGVIKEHMSTNMHGFDNLGTVDLGASFLSLLSGPTTNVPCYLQHLLDPKPVPVFNQAPLNHRTANGFFTGSRVSVLPSALWQQNMDFQNLTSKEELSPSISPNSTVNCSNSSALLQAANLNFQKSQEVACQNPCEEVKVKSVSSLIGNNNVGPVFANSWTHQKFADTTPLHKVQVKSNVFAYHHGHNPSSSFPRVFCSGISGNLLLNDTGLLGVVCACHGLFMSISKFSEHSGSHDFDPGNAVCMYNGGTVAHWWKTFSKSGIRVLEGHRRWDWPEGIPATSGLANSPISNVSNNIFPLNQVGPFTSSVAEQPQYSVINSKENQGCRNVVDYPYHKKDRAASRECSNSPFKYFTISSHGNLQRAADNQIWGMSNSSAINTKKGSQSTPAKLDSVCETANFLPALPNQRDLETPCTGFTVGGGASVIIERPGISSNVELRLGQPTEQSWTLGAKVPPASGSHLNDMHADTTNVFFPDKLLDKSNELQGSKWTLQYADVASNLAERRVPAHLENSGHVGGAYHAATDYGKELSCGNLEATDLNHLLLSCVKSPDTYWQFRNIYDNGGDSISEKPHYESRASRNENIYFPWTRLAGNITQHNNVSHAQNHMNNGKEVECDGNRLLHAAKSNIEFSKTFKDLNTANIVSGESSFNRSPAFHEKSTKLYQMSAMIEDESYGRDTSNNCGNISSFSDIRNFSHDHVIPAQNAIYSREITSMGSSKNSVFVQSATPTLMKEKFNGINPGLQDENMKMIAVQNMLELSNRDNGPASVRNVHECEILKIPSAKSMFPMAPSISKDHANLLDSSRIPKIPEVGEQSMLSGTICWMGHNSERFGTMTGRSLHIDDCDLPPVEQLFVRHGGTEFNFSHIKREQCSQGLPRAYVPEKCSCADQATCLTGKNDLNVDDTLVKERDISEVATSLFQSKLNENGTFLKERTESFEKTENLVSPNMKSVDPRSFQWRDVTKKVTESCSSSMKEKLTSSFNASLGSPVADAAKCSTVFVRNFVPLKEHEISNISSGCSAPDVTQSSVEVNKKDPSTVGVGEIRYVNNLVLDEGSENDRSWSSDDALDSELYAGIFASASRINLIKRGTFRAAPRKPSLSLIEEIRFQNLLKSKNAPNIIKRSSNIQEERDHLKKFEVRSRKRRKPVKWMKLGAPFPVSGQSSVNNEFPKCTEEVGQNAHSFWDMQMPVGCDQGSPSNCADSSEQSFKQRNSAFYASKGISLKRGLKRVYQGEQCTTEVHKSSKVDDTLEASEMFKQKTRRLHDASATSKEIRDICCNAELTAKLTSLDGPSGSPDKPNIYKWMARPIVFGKYGIISNGNPSKPTKIVPLRNVLKTAASHAEKSNRNACDNDKVKSMSVKVKKTSVRSEKETALRKKVLKSRDKTGETNNLLPTCDPNGEEVTASSSATNGSDDLSCALQKCNKHGITDSKHGVQLKTNFKEGRKRSLHELLVEGNCFKVVNSSVTRNSISLRQTTSRCWGGLVEDAVEGKVQTNEMSNAKRYSEKHQPENSDTFCCVCGSSDRDESNQLLECNKFLIKGLQSRDKAVCNENVLYGRCMARTTSCMLSPHGDSESLKLGENFLTCARTEGYKGRKREGFLRNHPQYANRNTGCLVPQEQFDAWLHIHRQKPQKRKGQRKFSSSIVESNCRKAYARYKQSKGWKHLVVYKSRIHALGLYTSQFISRRAMVVEYVGEIVGLRVADRRESEYHSGKKLQHKSACYFFRIDKEHIIDATRKGGISRFVNHSCQPNCVAKVISMRNEKKVVFFAERDIYPGEEITYDYHFNHEDEGEKIPCYCNSKNCRRFLN